MAIEVKENKVLVDVEVYKHLRYIEAKMDALECGGVDNWTWYGEALTDLPDEEDFTL